jgi:hypothetical protein
LYSADADPQLLTIQLFKMRNTSDFRLLEAVVTKLRSLAHENLDSVEAVWMEIIHTYLSLPRLTNVLRLQLFENLLLDISAQSIHLALQLMWYLQAALEDSAAADPMPSAHAASKRPQVLQLMPRIFLLAESFHWNLFT